MKFNKSDYNHITFRLLVQAAKFFIFHNDDEEVYPTYVKNYEKRLNQAEIKLIVLQLDINYACALSNIETCGFCFHFFVISFPPEILII